METHLLLAVRLVATPEGPDPDKVTPGLAGFLVMFALAIVTLLLARSMTRHLRKVRYSPDPAADDTPARRADGDPGGSGRAGGSAVAGGPDRR